MLCRMVTVAEARAQKEQIQVAGIKCCAGHWCLTESDKVRKKTLENEWKLESSEINWGRQG